MISGIVMIGVGLALTVTGQAGTWQPAVGNLLSVVGGILLSWSTATVRTVQQAREILKPQLEAVNRHLGTVSSQIGSVVKEVLSGQQDPGRGSL
jgi:drug/metabolite transporter (DMT)-like permease